MAITFVAAGTVAQGNGNLTVQIPAGIANGDILHLTLIGENTAFGTPSGWTLIQTQNIGTAGNANAVRISTYWKRTTGTESTFATSGGNVTFAQMLAYRGCLASGNPIRTSVGASAGSTASKSTPTISGLNTADTLVYGFATCNSGTLTPTTNKTSVQRATSSNVGSFFIKDTIGVGATSVTTPSTLSGSGSIGSAGSIGLTVDALITEPNNLTGAGTLKKLTGAGSIQQLNDVTGAGTIANVTGSGSILEEDDLLVVGTLGSLSGAAQIDMTEQVTGVGTIASVTGSGSILGGQLVSAAGIISNVTGAGSILEEDDLLIVGTLGSLSGAAQIDMTDEVTGAGLLGSLSASAEVDLVGIDLTGDGTLGSVSGAASILSNLELTGDGLLGSISGAGQIDLTDEVTVAGLLGSVVGQGAILEEEDLFIAATLGAISGDGSVEMSNDVTVEGMLGALSAAAEVDFVGIDLTGDGMLGAITGDMVVDLVGIDLTGDGMLGSLFGDGSIDMTDEVTGDGMLGSISGSGFVLSNSDIVIAGTLQSLTGDGAIDLQNGATINGVLGSITGAGAINLNNALTGQGLLGHITGAGEVDFATYITGAGTLRPLFGFGRATFTAPCYDVNDDKRELILSRLKTVLTDIAPTQRNDATIPSSTVPIIVLLDGDETAMEATFGRGRPANGPNIMTMTPEIYLTVAADSPEEAGQVLSAYEANVREAILGDAPLQTLVHNNSIRYVGNDTAVAVGARAFGQMSFEFAFDYALRLDVPCDPPDTVVDMSASQREAILQAVLSIAEQTEGVASVARNEASVPEDEEFLPRVLMLDGSEAADPGAWYKGRDPDSPNIMRMEPELYIVLHEGTTNTGQKLNQVRLMLLRGLLTDPLLAALSANGDIRYEGCQTALAAGRSLTGEMGMVLSIARVSKS